MESVILFFFITQLHKIIVLSLKISLNIFFYFFFMKQSFQSESKCIRCMLTCLISLHKGGCYLMCWPFTTGWQSYDIYCSVLHHCRGAPYNVLGTLDTAATTACSRPTSRLGWGSGRIFFLENNGRSECTDGFVSENETHILKRLNSQCFWWIHSPVHFHRVIKAAVS